jgi:hypothetical protein
MGAAGGLALNACARRVRKAFYSLYDERSPALITCRGQQYFEDLPHPYSGLRGG